MQCGRTPLHGAAMTGSTAVIPLLLNARANINAVTVRLASAAAASGGAASATSSAVWRAVRLDARV